MASAEIAKRNSHAMCFKIGKQILYSATARQSSQKKQYLLSFATQGDWVGKRNYLAAVLLKKVVVTSSAGTRFAAVLKQWL